jgi:hypothetical protein
MFDDERFLPLEFLKLDPLIFEPGATKEFIFEKLC